MMKKIEAVIRSIDLDQIKGVLETAAGCPVTATEAVCFGPSIREVRVYRGSSYVSDALPCVWLQLAIGEDRFAATIEALREAVQRGPARETGILVSDVEQIGAVSFRPRPPDGHLVPNQPARVTQQEGGALAGLAGWVRDPVASGV